MDNNINKYEESISIKIKPYEIDAAGHVNNIVYIKWLEDLRFKFFERVLPINDLLKLKLYPVIVSTNIIYKCQLKLNDKPTGYIKLNELKHNMMVLNFKILNGDRLCAAAEQRCILMNLESGTINKDRLKTFASLESNV